MRIFYVTQAGFDKASADSSHAAEVIQAFLGLGHKVTVFHTGASSTPVGWGAESLNYPMSLRLFGRIGFQFWAYFALSRTIRRNGGPDFIYVRHASLMISPSLIVRRKGGKLITEFNTLHAYVARDASNRLIAWLVQRIEATAIRYSSKLIAISEPLKRELIKFYGAEPSLIEVIGNGCNVDRMRPFDNTEVREQFNIPDGYLVVGFIGHLHPWQGVHELLAAFEMFQQSHPKSALIVAGGGPSFDAIAQQVETLKLTDKVFLPGPISYHDVPKYIASFSIAVAPGQRQESFDYRIRSPLKVFEYMACGKAVIAGRLESLECYFEDGQIGRLIKSGDSEELLRALSELTSDPAKLEKMGRAARRMAEERLQWSTIADQIISVSQSTG